MFLAATDAATMDCTAERHEKLKNAREVLIVIVFGLDSNDPQSMTAIFYQPLDTRRILQTITTKAYSLQVPIGSCITFQDLYNM